MSAKTVHAKFDDDRLSVHAGIPAEDALNRASDLMAQALSVSSDVADSCNDDKGWALHTLIEMAKAYLDAANKGMHFPSREQRPEVAQ